MKAPATFALLPLADLRAHEEVVEAKVVDLVAELRRGGVFLDPIWVARGTHVILNGHHRVAALLRLGAERVPAWILDYEGDFVELGRWTPGPPITKAEVLRRAAEGRLFPPQTTRHRLATALPARPTPLAELLRPPVSPATAAQTRGSSGSRPMRAGPSPPG